MDLKNLVGQTLDDKYRIDGELGRGGMGTVYLSTHVGTERPVAVKVIAPQFMQRPEFVERFRREARAAGRLRHPNVVDVTDFGFASTEDGQVAYLVMEYLDGCTLGEILEEEKNLPVFFSLDILEQVCSAVHEAHQQGIIHRDLKPDNIWLEPNQRGGYTVKVLDFGIAKLDLVAGATSDDSIHLTPPLPMRPVRPTMAGADDTVHDGPTPTLVSELATMAGVTEGSTLIAATQTLSLKPEAAGESATMLMDTGEGSEDGEDGVGTKLIEEKMPEPTKASAAVGFAGLTSASNTPDLTRVGAVLGTPLYMSPEQCRGERLDARSDVYSIGVIAYQMLSGKTPFTGEFTKVMEAHKTLPAPPFRVKKVRRKMNGVIASALSKDPNERPQSAEAFANALRSRSEGIFGLLRRSGMIYTEHMSKFLLLSLLFHIPVVIMAVVLVAMGFLRATETVSVTAGSAALTMAGVVYTLAAALCAYLINGTTSWIVIHSQAVPLRPIRLRDALKEARSKWKRFAGAGLLSTIVAIVVGCGLMIVGFVVPFLIIWSTLAPVAVAAGISLVVGFFLGAAAFIVMSVLLMLAVPVVMMEGSGVVASLKRSATLIRRSFVTALAALLIMFVMPAILAGLISFVVNITAQVIDREPSKPAVAAAESKDGGINVSIMGNQRPRIVQIFAGGSSNRSESDTKLRRTILETLTQVFILPLQILVTSFTAIIVALLYIKTRQAGGEPFRDLMAKFQESDQPRKKWQERVRRRLIQSGRISTPGKT
ncbi:MAG: protein kinase [Blastocatellia bacterium]|nr:protein kinase [Blastocatellia bacterium]